MANRDKGGGARKYDRNRKWCEAYRNRGQREINKARKLYRHLARFPDDVGAAKALAALPDPARRRAAILAKAIAS